MIKKVSSKFLLEEKEKEMFRNFVFIFHAGMETTFFQLHVTILLMASIDFLINDYILHIQV